MLLKDRSLRWTKRDVVVLVTVAFAFSWLYIAWDFLYDHLLAGLGLPLWSTSLINGMWFLAGFVGFVLVRKPGACVFAQTLAALLEIGFAHGLLGGYPIDVIGEAYTHVYAVLPQQLEVGRLIATTPDGYVYAFSVVNMVGFVGLLEGLGPEMVFGFGLYRNLSLGIFLGAALTGAFLEWLTGIYVTQYYLYFGTTELLATMASSAVGIMLGAGLLSWWLARRLVPAAERA